MPPTSASVATAIHPTIDAPPGAVTADRSRPTYTSHSEAKPHSGGKAASAASPTRSAAPVRGSRARRPPMRSRSRPWTACATAPAPMKASPFIAAWFHTCSSAPAQATAAIAASPRARADRARPTASAITPMFSTLE